MPPDPLIDALRAGDARAFEDVIRRYGGRLVATCRRLLADEEEARDCVQEALLKAFRQIGQFEGRAEFGTWLHRIAVNQALMRRRAQASSAEEQIDHLLPDFDDHGQRNEPHWQFQESVEDMLVLIPEYSVVMGGVAARPLIAPELTREIALVSLAGRRFQPAVAAFLRAIRSYPWCRPAPVGAARARGHHKCQASNPDDEGIFCRRRFGRCSQPTPRMMEESDGTRGARRVAGLRVARG